MNYNSLARFIAEVKKVWGPLSSKNVATRRQLLQELAQSSVTEEWQLRS